MAGLREYEYLVLEAPIRAGADPGLPSQLQMNRYGQEGWKLSTIVRGADRWFIYLARERESFPEPKTPRGAASSQGAPGR